MHESHGFLAEQGNEHYRLALAEAREKKAPGGFFVRWLAIKLPVRVE